VAEPDVRPPGAASPSEKSISVVEIPLAAMANGKWRRKQCPRTKFKLFTINFFWVGGTPVPVEVCPRQPWSLSIYSTCKNLRAQHPLRAQIQSPEKCALRWVNIHVNNFSFVDQSSPTFFRPTWDGLWLINYFFDFRYVDPFRGYSRSKSKVVRNLAGFWTFFRPPKF